MEKQWLVIIFTGLMLLWTDSAVALNRGAQGEYKALLARYVHNGQVDYRGLKR